VGAGGRWPVFGLIQVKDWTVGGDPDSVPMLQGGGVPGIGLSGSGAPCLARKHQEDGAWLRV
jgi:hypothetical protein